MQAGANVPFTSKDGLSGVVSSPGDASHPQAEILLDDGRRIRVHAGLLQRAADGSVYLPVNLAEADAGAGTPAATAPTPLVIPLAEERLEAAVRRVVTGTVRVSTHVVEREEVADLPLAREEVRVERVPVGRTLEAPATVRQEGDTVIVPVMEEVLVVEKRLVLREEVRLTTVRSQARQPQSVTLRREEATVERLPGENGRGGEKQ